MQHARRRWTLRTTWIVAVVVATVAALVGAHPAPARSTYRVTYGTPTGADWRRDLRGPFAISGAAVTTTGGPSRNGDLGQFVLDTGSEDVVIAGGTVTMEGTYAWPASVRGVVRLVNASGGSSFRSITSTSGPTTVVLPRGGRILQIGMETFLTAAADVGSNRLTVGPVVLDLDDSAPPLVAVHPPSPTTWFGARECVPVAASARDSGSGLTAMALHRVSDGSLVGSRTIPVSAGLRPGAPEVDHATCIPPGLRQHGLAEFRWSATDVAGLVGDARFSVASDLRAPGIELGVAPGAVEEAPWSVPGFTVHDVDSGLASVSASIDGAAASVAGSGAARSLQTAPLLPGAHVVVVRAVDAVGNASVLERRVHVRDTIAPTLAWTSPTSPGAPNARVEVRASDAVSGIDAQSWTLTVNGSLRPIHADGETTASGAIGPLAPGAHVLVVRVADGAGNVATSSATYVVAAPVDVPSDVASVVAQRITEQTGAPVAADAVASSTSSGPGAAAAAAVSAAASPDGTSAWIVRRGPLIASSGHWSSVTLLVARAGVPVEGRLVTVQLADAVVASGLTAANGLVTLPFRIGGPGRYQVTVDSVGVLALPLQVAPDVVLTNRSRRVVRGGRITLVGRLRPGMPGWPVVLQARSGLGGWFVVRPRITTGRGGSFRTTISANASGRFQLRARVGARRGWAAAISPPIEVHVR